MEEVIGSIPIRSTNKSTTYSKPFLHLGVLVANPHIPCSEGSPKHVLWQLFLRTLLWDSFPSQFPVFGFQSLLALTGPPPIASAHRTARPQFVTNGR